MIFQPGHDDLLLIPDRQQVLLDELQDRVEPHPEAERLPWNILLYDWKKRE